MREYKVNSVFNTDTRCSVDGRKRYENDYSVDGNRFENGAKQYQFSFENGVVWTGSQSANVFPEDRN